MHNSKESAEKPHDEGKTNIKELSLLFLRLGSMVFDCFIQTTHNVHL